MPNYEYKIIEWEKADADEPIDVIQDNVDDRWEYYDNVQLHAGRVDFIFRRTV